MKVFETLESEVRFFIRGWPTVFKSGSGCHLYDTDGREYIDFFSGAGALNYGHNEPSMINAAIDYMRSDGIMHSLDMGTEAKAAFMQALHDTILQPRGLDYKLQFTGPTGTDAVEAALKLARKVTGRQTVVSFVNGFHGVSLGALAVTSNRGKRRAAGVPLSNACIMPYDGGLGEGVSTVEYMEQLSSGAGTGWDEPAAVIVETVQGEGGLRMASREWLRQLGEFCKRHGSLLIVDEIQTGCGRTGPFLSFEPSGIVPDIVCMSKSLSGFGAPMALLLLKPEVDVWQPGDHVGTFRGFNPAFVAGKIALGFWAGGEFEQEILARGEIVRASLNAIVDELPILQAKVRGRGLLQGLYSPHKGFWLGVRDRAFQAGLVIHTSGADAEAIRLMPPLNIARSDLQAGIEILHQSIHAAARDLSPPATRR